MSVTVCKGIWATIMIFACNADCSQVYVSITERLIRKIGKLEIEIPHNWWNFAKFHHFGG